MASSSKAPAFDAETFARYEKLVALIPGVEIKGVTMPYTSVNGNMFSFLSSDGTLHLRLPEALREEVISQFKSSISMQHGRQLKEYVVITSELLTKKARLEAYFLSSFQYTAGLKPKPTKR